MQPLDSGTLVDSTVLFLLHTGIAMDSNRANILTTLFYVRTSLTPFMTVVIAKILLRQTLFIEKGA